MTEYILIVSSIIEEYKKTITKYEKLKKRFCRKSVRMEQQITLGILYLRLESLEVIKEFLVGTLSDYSRLKDAVNILKFIIEAEEDLDEHYNASVLECLMRDIKTIL